MESRRGFITGLAMALSAAFAAFAAGCSSQPDVITEPSPEWPPPEE